MDIIIEKTAESAEGLYISIINFKPRIWRPPSTMYNHACIIHDVLYRSTIVPSKKCTLPSGTLKCTCTITHARVAIGQATQ